MKTLKYNPNQPITPQLNKWIKMVRDIHKTPQIGQALTVPITKFEIDYKDLVRQCVEIINKNDKTV